MNTMITRVWSLTIIALVLFVTTLGGAQAAACTSGVIQLQKYDWKNLASELYDCFPTSYISSNSIKGLCGVAFKVHVTSKNIIQLIPLSTATYNYSYPGPGPSNLVLPCKDLNASGLFNAGSSTAGTVMLYDDVGGPLTYLNRTGNVIRLQPGHAYSYRSAPPVCKYNYTVVSGCVMGVSAPSQLPAPSCPKNWYVATGRYGIQYCSPCAPGFESVGGKVTKCTACPRGTYNSNYGDSCKKCDPGYYSNKVGSSFCDFCEYFDNKYTDGKTCKPCPAQSWVASSGTYPAASQCVRCNKGVKCCTTGSNGNCPPCKVGQLPDTKNYTSVFALASASSPACLKSNIAFCTSKWKATIDFTCGISVEGLQKNAPGDVYCDFQATQAIKGPKADAKTDFAQFDGYGWDDYSLLGGNATAVQGPLISFTFRSNKCTLTYRAITAPAATLLGVLPKAGTSTSCPAGQYLDKNPGSCLPCPPGTYNPKPSSKTSCTPCPAGLYTRQYGSTSCSKCPPQLTPVTSATGATGCTTCNYDEAYVGNSKCGKCPTNTAKYSGNFPGCIGDNNGNVCCGLGNCGGAPSCPKNLPTYNQDSSTGAVFQLVSTNLAGGSCKNATLLSCLEPGAYVGYSTNGNSFNYYPIMQPKCVTGSDSYASADTINGGIVSHKRAVGSDYVYGNKPEDSYTSGYEFTSNKAKNTLTITLSKNSDPSVTLIPSLTTCSATFKLVAGYAFDLTPPTNAKCPTGLIPVKISGRTFCKACWSGAYKKGSSCADCPKGTFQRLLGSTSCSKCPIASSCPSASIWPTKCNGGYYGDVQGLAECKKCGKDTYSETAIGAKKCLKCPQYTAAPEAASVCGVPFLTKF